VQNGKINSEAGLPDLRVNSKSPLCQHMEHFLFEGRFGPGQGLLSGFSPKYLKYLIAAF
jgi:hypothetical protein